MLDICAKKEQEKWLKGKKTNLLTCELEQVLRLTALLKLRLVIFSIHFCSRYASILMIQSKKVLNPLRDLNEQYSGKIG